MAKLQKVTNADLSSASDAAGDLLADIADIANRLEKGYADALDRPVDIARMFAALAGGASDLAVHLLAKASLDEQKRELETLMRERAL